MVMCFLSCRNSSPDKSSPCPSGLISYRRMLSPSHLALEISSLIKSEPSLVLIFSQCVLGLLDYPKLFSPFFLKKTPNLKNVKLFHIFPSSRISQCILFYQRGIMLFKKPWSVIIRTKNFSYKTPTNITEYLKNTTLDNTMYAS